MACSPARRGVWRLRITLDAKYPGDRSLAKASIVEVADRAAGETPRQGCVELYSDWKHWICVFPQHGPGPKHERRIALEPWQGRLVSSHPDAFLAGLIHSDGCRIVNRVKTYAYPRYFFSNVSADIRDLFVAACGLVAVDCRSAGIRNISVARRGSVDILESVGRPEALSQDGSLRRHPPAEPSAGRRRLARDRC